jgi:glucose/arabinose dehydrogenase
MPHCATAAALGLVLAAGAAGAELRTELVAGGLAQPIFLTAPADDLRLFVLERDGRILVLDGGSALPFLDIRDRVDASEGEGGLLGLAFPKDYASAGVFYVYYTTGDEAVSNDLVSRLSRFHAVGDPATSNSADPDGEAILFSLPQPRPNHDGGTVAIRGDYLYLGLGDGGEQGDPNDRAQDDASPFGKLLRFDLRLASPAPETWAKGFRNPFRFSFDRETGDLYVGDVGQNEREEIDVEPAASAGGFDYGWNVEEGSACFDPDPGELPCGDPALVRPVFEYLHVAQPCGGSVVGGAVYRGSAIPSLRGQYLFADYCTGRIWSLEWDGAGGTQGPVLDRTAELAPAPPLWLDQIVAFGEDGFGELYVVELGGSVFRIVPEPGALPLGLAAGGALAALGWRRRGTRADRRGAAG